MDDHTKVQFPNALLPLQGSWGHDQCTFNYKWKSRSHCGVKETLPTKKSKKNT